MKKIATSLAVLLGILFLGFVTSIPLFSVDPNLIGPDISNSVWL